MRLQLMSALRVVGLALVLAAPASAKFVAGSLTPEGTTGPGGSITYSEIGSFDPTSAVVYADFTALASIDVSFRVDNTDPVTLDVVNINDTNATWTGFVATVIGGSAVFREPNNPFDAHGTYANPPSFRATLSDAGRTVTFAGGAIVPGDILETFLGIAVTDPTQAVTVRLTPFAAGPAVPEPSTLVMSATALIGLAALRRGRRGRGALGLAVAAALSCQASTAEAQGPAIAPAYQGRLAVGAIGGVGGMPAQMTFGPGGRLYVMTVDAGALSYAVDPTTGTLVDGRSAAPNVRGIGLGFRGTTMYATTLDGTLRKLTDDNGNGVWGEAGELDVAIVTGITVGDHAINQIQITGKTLYVGVGTRTQNGQVGSYTGGVIDDLGGAGYFGGGLGRTYGDSAYNGTICWIQDLDAVVDQTGAANAWTVDPPPSLQARLQQDPGPFADKSAGRLVVHSAGTRNPFGLCLDGSGALWFTNNFHRMTTLGNGRVSFGLRGDQTTSNFGRDVHDQLFRAVAGADYGYSNTNWRGVNPMLTPGTAGYTRVVSTTFDNLFNKGPYPIHDPANPDGLGPSASADGCGFFGSSRLPAELRDNLFVVRFTASVTETGGAQRTLRYGDLVAVDVATGKVRQVATGFNGPLAVLADEANSRLLVACFNDRTVFAVQAIQP